MLPRLERGVLAQAIALRFGHEHELLVGGGVPCKLVARCLETRGEAMRQLDGVPADAQVAIVFEQRVELEAEQASFRKYGSAALHHGEEMLGELRTREHRGLAAERAYLGAADVERIDEARDVGQRHVACGRGEAVAEARAVEEEPLVLR